MNLNTQLPQDLPPLPVRVRLYRGEDLMSFSHRLAERNGSDIGEIETGVRERGVRLPRRRWTPERAQVWRQLGQLHDRAFTTPETINGETVLTRELCAGCTCGAAAFGKRPDIGLVCLRHQRWLDPPQRSVHTYPAAVTAERIFRQHLATRKVLFDSFAMDLGKLCASPIFIGPAELDRRTNESGIEYIPILIYPEQVQIARLVTTPTFLDFVTNSEHQTASRRKRVAEAVARIIPDRPDSEGWRAVDRIWDAVLKLTHLRRESLIWGAPVRDTYYNLLRFVDLPDMAATDIWAGPDR